MAEEQYKTVPFAAYVRKRGTLKTKVDSDFLSNPNWGQNFINSGVYLFNNMSRTYNLGVTFELLDPNASSVLPPDVIVKTHDGTGHYIDTRGKPMTINIGSAKSNEYRGATHREITKGSLADKADDIVFQSWVYMFNTPFVNGVAVHSNVRMVVLLHELIHACGIGAAEPNHGDGSRVPEGVEHDLFNSGGMLMQGDDFLQFLTVRAPTKHGTFELSGTTQKLIRNNWKIAP